MMPRVSAPRVLGASLLLVALQAAACEAGWADCEVGSFAQAAAALGTRRCTEIEVSHSGPLGDLSVGPFADFIAALATDTAVRKVELEDNHLGPEGAKVLVGALIARGTDLYSLEISRNAIGDAGATAVTDFLRKSRALRALDLSDNGFGDAAAVAIANTVPTQLHDLELGQNQISDDGALALVDAAFDKLVHELDLSGNAVTDQGAKAIASAITARDPTTLRKLSLMYNLLGPEGLEALQACVPAWQAARRKLKFSSRAGEASYSRGAAAQPPRAAPPLPAGGSRSPALQWTEVRVKEWLLGLHPQFKKYAGAIHNNAVDGRVLLTLTDKDLLEMGIENGLHRRRILTEVAALLELKGEL